MELILFLLSMVAFSTSDELQRYVNKEGWLITSKLYDYNKLAPPVKKATDTIKVTFGVNLQQIVGVDEKEGMLHTNMWLNYEWHDYRFEWNESLHDGIRSIRLPSNLIWTPDVMMYNSADEDIDRGLSNNVVIFSTGRLHWIPRGLYTSSCSINIKWFPFDNQTCFMKFGSWTYSGDKLNLTLLKPTVDISYYQESTEWELIEYSGKRNAEVYDCCPEEYLDLTFTLHIKRRVAYYVYNLIIPCALISTLTLLTFLLPPAGGKISLSVTIILSLTVLLTVVADAVPLSTMSAPLISIYFTINMLLCTLSVIMTVLVLNFHHRNPDMYEVPMWIRQIVCRWLAKILCLSRPGKAKRHDLESKTPLCVSLTPNGNVIPVGNAIPVGAIPVAVDEHVVAEDTNDWKFAARVIDRLCFWVFSVIMIITTCAIFLDVPNRFIIYDIF